MQAGHVRRAQLNGDDYGRLIYLGLLLVAVGSWVFVQNRQGIGKTLQQLAIWAFIFSCTCKRLA